MRHIAKNPDAGNKCIGNFEEAKKLFENPLIGNIEVPSGAGARIVVFETGEEALEEGSSVIIDLPPYPPPAPPDVSREWTDKELMTFVLGNYKYW
jgi:hypothetical protein